VIEVKKFQYIVRQCKFDEIPKVVAINESTLPENYPTYFYEQIIEKYPESFMVAELVDEPGRLIGYIMWRVERGISSFGIQLVRKGHLVSIAVIEDYRCNKVATTMLRESMKKVLEYGVEEFVLEVRLSNENAVKLYEDHFHFKKCRLLERYYRDGENAHYMALKSEDLKLDEID
jgi:ribosomal-protein-alanine N-acetyltransferase